MSGRVLVAGIGNVFLGDDGFGVEVVRRLSARDLPPDVEVVDVGIRGVHLAYQLLDGYRALVLVDATARGGDPGDLYVIEPDLDAFDRPTGDGALLDAHSMDPETVLRTITALARETGSPRIGRVLLVGCEPADVTEGMGLTDPVAGAVDGAVDLVLDVLADELGLVA